MTIGDLLANEGKWPNSNGPRSPYGRQNVMTMRFVLGNGDDQWHLMEWRQWVMIPKEPGNVMYVDSSCITEDVSIHEVVRK